MFSTTNSRTSLEKQAVQLHQQIKNCNEYMILRQQQIALDVVIMRMRIKIKIYQDQARSKHVMAT